jgi:tetratricopeptide (TPR) repeat protein
MFSDLQCNTGDAAKATALKNEGNQLFLREQISDAVRKYKEALGCNPKDHSVHSNISRCYLMMGDVSSAKEHAEKCTKFAPNWTKGWYRLGKVHAEKEAYIDAAGAFQHALDLDPSNLELKRELAEAQYLADKLGNGDPGFDARTQGIFYTMQQSSWVYINLMIIRML